MSTALLDRIELGPELSIFTTPHFHEIFRAAAPDFDSLAPSKLQLEKVEEKKALQDSSQNLSVVHYYVK